MIETITTFLAGDGGVISLFISAFISATLFPGGSEAILAGTIAALPEPGRVLILVLIATVANSAGSMTSWFIGRMLPEKKEKNRALSLLEHYGAPVLVLAWLPVVGDALPLAAGWLRIRFLPALLWITLGKLMRYGIVAATVLGLL